MTPVMRNAHLEMKAIYNRLTEGPVFMSERKLAKLINVARETASIALAGLEHYGFIRKVRGGYLGADGCGLATEWRMTDERYLGESATLNFKRWDGVVFVPPAKKKKQKPGLKTSPVLDQKLVHPGLEISPVSYVQMLEDGLVDAQDESERLETLFLTALRHTDSRYGLDS
jgi:DNA-binding transcriptional MocR family regulator